MKRLTIRETRAVLGRLDELLGREGEILVTRRGKPMARLLPVTNASGFPDHSALRQKMRPVKIPSEVLIRRMRDES